MKINSVSIILLAIILLGCKDENKKDNSKEAAPKVDYNFVVEATLKTDQADTFQFVMKDIDLETTIDKTVLKVQENFQDITGTVKAKYYFEYPTLLYLGLGYIKPKKVIIQSFKISYKGKEHIFTPRDFEEYFTINKYVEYGEKEGELITKMIDGKHVPIIGLSRKGIDLIK